MKEWSLFPLLGLYLAASIAWAEGDAPAKDWSGGMLERTEALARAQQADTNAFPDADTVLADGLVRVRYEADGTYEQWHEEYTKILTEKGRRGLTTLSSYYTIPYQRGPEDCRIALVEIIHPDGTADAIDVESQSRTMVNPASMGQNIYNPNDKIIRLNIPGLDIGDTLHFVMYDRIVQPRMTNTWSDWLTFESTSPILRNTVEIDAPAALPLVNRALKAPVDDTVREEQRQEGDRIIYRWTASDVPRMFSEPGMPPLHTVVQRQLLSTVPDWQTISRWYWNLSLPHLDTDEAIRDKVLALTADAQTPRERMDALFRFVSQDVRYMGIIAESTAPGYEPHDVTETFAERHGVCRDKAALLVAMLRAAGFDAFPTLIHVGPKKDEDVPQPYFNHAIVAVRMEDGAYALMDPTDETTTEWLPAYLGNKSYLVATPEGDRLRTSPVPPAKDNLMVIHTTGNIDATGGLLAETELKFEGVNDNAYRGWFARTKPEDRRRFFETLVKRTVAGAVVDSLDITPEDMMDTSTTLVVRLAYHAPDILVGSGDITMLPLPLMGTRVGMANFIIGRTGLKKRKYPIVTEVACGIRESVELKLPAVIEDIIALPDYEPVADDKLAWSIAVQATQGVIRAQTEFLLEAPEYSPDEYLRLKDMLKRIEKDLRKMPVLKHQTPAPARPDVEVISDNLKIDIADDSSWTETRSVRKRILTYAGKKSNGELKLRYNTAWEDITLDEAVVTDTNGIEHAVGTNAVNLMDAAWVGSAPRYPVAKTLVVSLPAIEIGSEISYRYSRKRRKRPFFMRQFQFRSFDRILEKTCIVTAPADWPLAIHGTNLPNIAYLRVMSSNRVKYAWQASRSEPVRREPDLPPWWCFMPTAMLSSGNFSNYAADVHQRLLAAANDNEATAKQARELTDGLTRPLEQIRAIRDYVAIHVRRAGPGLGAMPLDTISAADITLRDGYGNSPDRAVLLYSMLETIGLRPKLVLVSSRPDLAIIRERLAEIPNYGPFSTVLVKVETPEGMV